EPSGRAAVPAVPDSAPPIAPVVGQPHAGESSAPLSSGPHLGAALPPSPLEGEGPGVKGDSVLDTQYSVPSPVPSPPTPLPPEARGERTLSPCPADPVPATARLAEPRPAGADEEVSVEGTRAVLGVETEGPEGN